MIGFLWVCRIRLRHGLGSFSSNSGLRHTAFGLLFCLASGPAQNGVCIPSPETTSDAAQILGLARQQFRSGDLRVGFMQEPRSANMHGWQDLLVPTCTWSLHDP